MVATTGSSIAVIPARVAEIWRRALTISAKGTIPPRTTIHSISSQRGRCVDARFPRSETWASTRRPGKLHHGGGSDQKIVGKRKPQGDREIGTRAPNPW